MSDFGIAFKTARESKGLTLEQVATETRIGTRFLDAIEKGEFHLLPGGIFSRGFVRSYAEKLGLDPDKAVADFERLSNYREPSVMEGLRVSTEQPGKANRTLYPVAIGALIILVIVFYVVTQETPTAVTASQPPAPVTAPVIAAPPPIAPPQAPTTVEAAAPAEPAPASDALTLDIEATATTWIKVSADGTTLVSGQILHAGMTRRFSGQTSISLSVGNAGGITVKVNDHEIAPLGKSGQVRFLTITPENLKDIIG